MILITGATGTIGSDIVRQLTAGGVPVRALTRDPERADVPDGVDVARGDYRDAASIAAAVKDVEAVFLVGVLGPDDVDVDRGLVELARAAGVRRVVKLSAIGTGDSALGRVGTWHLPGENAVRDSGLDWTILRPSVFASITRSWAADINAGRPVANLTGLGAQGVVDPRDVSAVAAAALVSADHAGRIYTLTGPDLLTGPDQAAILAEVLARPVDTVDVPEHTAREHMLAAGMSAEFADGALAGQAYVRAGRNAVRTPDVADVLGRPPRSFATWATDHAHLFTA
ncbi:MAG: NAD(P)H-binding protein [Mycobacteriaceae bacterium]|nr:NAD(P)H-binding protein [Mycobacteriaceae bacterium]